MVESGRQVEREGARNVKTIPATFFEHKMLSVTKVASKKPNSSSLFVTHKAKILFPAVGEKMIIIFSDDIHHPDFSHTKKITEILALADGSYLVCTESGSDYLVEPGLLNEPEADSVVTGERAGWKDRLKTLFRRIS